MNLYEATMFPWVFDCKKHGLHPNPDQYAEMKFNQLTPAEQLRAVSDGLERMKEQEL